MQKNVRNFKSDSTRQSETLYKLLYIHNILTQHYHDADAATKCKRNVRINIKPKQSVNSCRQERHAGIFEHAFPSRESLTCICKGGRGHLSIPQNTALSAPPLWALTLKPGTKSSALKTTHANGGETKLRSGAADGSILPIIQKLNAV